MEQSGCLRTLSIPFILLYLLYLLEGVNSEKLFHNRDHSDVELQNHRQADAIVSPEEAQV